MISLGVKTRRFDRQWKNRDGSEVGFSDLRLGEGEEAEKKKLVAVVGDDRRE